MDKIALVSVDLERGAEIIGILEKAGLKINVALWFYSSEYEDWRLAVASRQLDAIPLPEARRMVVHALAAADFGPEKTPPILILPMTDSTVRDLRRRYSKARNVEGSRPGGQMLGDRFIEDAYVYRVS